MSTRLETETVVVFNDLESVAYITTRQKTMIRRLDKLLEQGIRDVTHDGFQADYKRYIVPKKWIKIAPPRRLSAKQKQVLEQGRKKGGFKRKDAG